MNPETKEKLNAQAEVAKNKALAAVAWCQEKIAATWKSGRKGKAICIGVAALVLFLMMRCGGGSDGIGGDWKYDGEPFANAFGTAKEDEGVIYNGGFVDGFLEGWNVNHGIKVMQATREGNLVECEGKDRLVWVVTQKHYEDGEKLGDGFYIRRGSHEYEGFGGIQHTVARYVEVTDKGVLRKLQKQVDDAKAAKEKAKLDAEGKPFEVDAPVKSLCGFVIGATPSSVDKSLFTNPSGGENMSGKLAKPFRHFDFAELKFEPVPVLGGQHLSRVELRIWDRPTLGGPEVYFEEVETIVAMFEKKFGIKFRKTEERRYNSLSGCSLWYKWESEGGEDRVRQSIAVYFSNTDIGVIFNSDLISDKERKALEEKQRPARLSADAGADQL